MTSQDSGYVSTQPKTRDAKRSLKASTSNESFLAIDPMSDSKTGNAPPGLRIDTWRLNTEPARPSSISTVDVTHGRSPSEVSPGAEPPSIILQSPPMDWPQTKDENSWWTDKPVPNASELTSTARALQDQAEALRLMADRPQDNAPAYDASLRRQTIALPLPSDSNEFRYDLLQNRTYQNMSQFSGTQLSDFWIRVWNIRRHGATLVESNSRAGRDAGLARLLVMVGSVTRRPYDGRPECWRSHGPLRSWPDQPKHGNRTRGFNCFR